MQWKIGAAAEQLHSNYWVLNVFCTVELRPGGAKTLRLRCPDSQRSVGTVTLQNALCYNHFSWTQKQLKWNLNGFRTFQ